MTPAPVEEPALVEVIVTMEEPTPVEVPGPVEVPALEEEPTPTEIVHLELPAPVEELVPEEPVSLEEPAPLDEVPLNTEPVIVDGRWQVVNIIGSGGFGTLDYLSLLCFSENLLIILNCRPCISCSRFDNWQRSGTQSAN